MKSVNLGLLVALCFPTIANAAEDDYSELLRKQGFSYCAPAINKVANWLIDQDAGTLSQWKEGGNADNHVGILMANKRYKDVNVFLHLGASKNNSGGCDLTFSTTYIFEQSCSSIRETTFKGWKYYGEMQGLAIYEDPTTTNVQVTFQSTGSGCVVMKTGAFFYNKDDISGLNK